MVVPVAVERRDGSRRFFLAVHAGVQERSSDLVPRRQASLGGQRVQEHGIGICLLPPLQRLRPPNTSVRSAQCAISAEVGRQWIVSSATRIRSVLNG